MDLEQRLRRIEDRFELQDLVVKYFNASDDDDYPALEATFTPEVTFVGSGFGEAKGRAAVMEFLITSRAAMGLTVHTPNYVLIDFDGEDRATGQVGAHLELTRGGKGLFGAVRYLDQYVRLEEGWRIHRRHMLVIHISPWEEVGSAFASELCIRWPGVDPLPSDLPKKRID